MTTETSQDSICVAVLDDDITFIRLVERVLGTEGIAVLPVTTLALDEAVTVIGSSHCDVALVDIYMYGDAAGFKLIEMLRADPATAHLPIVVTSGARREIGKRVDFLRRHRCEVLLKPFGVEELIALVTRATAATPEHRHAEQAPAEAPSTAAGAPALRPAVS